MWGTIRHFSVYISSVAKIAQCAWNILPLDAPGLWLQEISRRLRCVAMWGPTNDATRKLGAKGYRTAVLFKDIMYQRRRSLLWHSNYEAHCELAKSTFSSFAANGCRLYNRIFFWEKSTVSAKRRHAVDITDTFCRSLLWRKCVLILIANDIRFTAPQQVSLIHELHITALALCSCRPPYRIARVTSADWTTGPKHVLTHGVCGGCDAQHTQSVCLWRYAIAHVLNLKVTMPTFCL